MSNIDSRGQGAWYALRRTLPLWSFSNNLQELKDFLHLYKVDELIVKVDTEEFTHGQVPQEWLEGYLPRLMEIKNVLDEMNVVYSVNPWITSCHCDRGRDGKAVIPGLTTVVGHDGVECTACACVLSEAWQQHTAKLWRTYASTTPHIMWVEDDIRTFNHAPVRYGCFCELHMKRFSELVGQPVKREELVAAILKPGKPHPWREVYLKMQQQIMIDTVKLLGEAVHAVSPETRMGLMSSGVRQHCLELRDWEKFGAALADGKPLYSRPPMCNYTEESLRGFYYSHDSIKATRKALPGAIEQTEVENWPFTRYGNSVAFTFVEMAISFAYGCDGITMNLYDHTGKPMEEEGAFGKMLGREKPYLNALAQAAQVPGEYAGVRLLQRTTHALERELPEGADYPQLGADNYDMMYALEACGVPTTYDDGVERPVAESGQTLRSYSDDEIRTLLKGGLLLDAQAVKVLVERGFASEIGLKTAGELVDRTVLGPLGAEEYFNPDFGGYDRNYMTLTLPWLNDFVKILPVETLDDVQVISVAVDPDGLRREVMMYAYTNNLGGRVVCHLMDYATATGYGFFNPTRRRQLQHAVNFISNRTPEILFQVDGAWPLAFVKRTANYDLAGVFNLNLDDWESWHFELAWPSDKLPEVTMLTADGTWQKLGDKLKMTKTNGMLELDGSVIVSFKRPLILKLER